MFLLLQTGLNDCELIHMPTAKHILFLKYSCVNVAFRSARMQFTPSLGCLLLLQIALHVPTVLRLQPCLKYLSGQIYEGKSPLLNM
jgi:hypothetical protein